MESFMTEFKSPVEKSAITSCPKFDCVCWNNECKSGEDALRRPSYLAGVNPNMDRSSVGLFSLHTLNVDDVLLPVDLYYFANLLALVVSTDNLFQHHNKVKQMHPHQFSDEHVSRIGYGTWTSSSLRMGMDLTLYFCRSSLDKGEDMIFLLMCEGALKCLLRFLRREDVTNGFSFMMLEGPHRQLKLAKPNYAFYNWTSSQRFGTVVLIPAYANV